MNKKNSIRQLALDCLLQLEEDNTPVGFAIDDAIQRTKPSVADRRLLSEFVYGVIRWRKQLDWILKHFVEPRFRLDKRTRNILRLGVYQLLHMDKIPPYAAIYETVELAKPKRKTARFINAVMRSIQRRANSLEYPPLDADPARHIAISLSYPLWLVRRWIVQHDVEWTLNFCRANNQVAPLSIRVNTLKTDPTALLQSLTHNGVAVKKSQIVPEGLSFTDSPPLRSLQAYHNGWFYVQDESAMLIAHLLRPQQGEKVVDLCAAPGGKTTHIAQLMENSGRIIAVDVSSGQIERIAENCRRLGITNVHPQIADAATGTFDFIADVDRVLLDVPCSGLGTLRRHPDIRWKKTPEQINALARLQSQILQNTASQIKPSTVLVYSTCSTEPEENQEIIHRFLETHPHFAIENARDFLPFVPPSAITSEGFLQTFPHEHGIDGVFAARLTVKKVPKMPRFARI